MALNRAESIVLYRFGAYRTLAHAVVQCYGAVTNTGAPFSEPETTDTIFGLQHDADYIVGDGNRRYSLIDSALMRLSRAEHSPNRKEI